MEQSSRKPNFLKDRKSAECLKSQYVNYELVPSFADTLLNVLVAFVPMA